MVDEKGEMDLEIQNVGWFIHSDSEDFQRYITQAVQRIPIIGLGAACFIHEGFVVFLTFYLINLLCRWTETNLSTLNWTQGDYSPGLHEDTAE